MPVKLSREQLVDKNLYKPSDWIGLANQALHEAVYPTSKIKICEENYYQVNDETNELQACLGGLLMVKMLKIKRKQSSEKMFHFLLSTLEDNPLNATDLECALDSLRIGQVSYFMFFLGYGKLFGNLNTIPPNIKTRPDDFINWANIVRAQLSENGY